MYRWFGQFSLEADGDLSLYILKKHVIFYPACSFLFFCKIKLKVLKDGSEATVSGDRVVLFYCVDSFLLLAGCDKLYQQKVHELPLLKPDRISPLPKHHKST